MTSILPRPAAALLLTLVIACAEHPTAPMTGPATIAIELADAALYPGDVVTPSAVVRDGNGQTLPGTPITWSVSDVRIAVTTATGVTTLLNAGQVTLTAHAGSLVASRTLTVRPLTVLTVTVLIPQPPFARGDIVPLVIRVLGEGGRTVPSRKVAITSDNPSVALIDPSGRVRAVSAGVSTLHATADGVEGTATIEVLAQDALLTLGRVDGAQVPIRVAADTVEWNGIREYHEVFLESGQIRLTGGATPTYALDIRSAEYRVTGPAGARQYVLLLTTREHDHGVVQYDGRGDLQMTSEYIGGLSHSAAGTAAGLEVRFRVPGDNQVLTLLYRRE